MEGIENVWRKIIVVSLFIKFFIVWNKYGNLILEAVEEYVCD